MCERSLSDGGLQALKNREGFRAVVYDDATGKPVPYGQKPQGNLTVGYGHKLAWNEHYPNPITRAQAESLLKTDVLEAEIAVRDFFTAHNLQPTQNQFDAVVLMVFNTGTLPLREGFGALLGAGKWQQAADRMLLWDHETKDGVLVPSEGLHTRRIQERRLFLTP